MEINLIAGNYSLDVQVVNTANSWCRVYFMDSQKGSSVFLGADSLKIICSRICSALKKVGKGTQKCDILEKRGNLDLFWILSLAEQHAAIYGSLIENFGIKIFCVEDGGHFLPEIYLGKQDLATWISILEDVIH